MQHKPIIPSVSNNEAAITQVLLSSTPTSSYPIIAKLSTTRGRILSPPQRQFTNLQIQRSFQDSISKMSSSSSKATPAIELDKALPSAKNRRTSGMFAEFVRLVPLRTASCTSSKHCLSFSASTKAHAEITVDHAFLQQCAKLSLT